MKSRESIQSPHAASVDATLAALESDAKRGLTEAEARSRLAIFGLNELAVQKPVPSWRKFLAQFQDVLVILLLVATAISAVLWLVERETALPYEAIVIFAIVLLNAAMGYFQEARAESAVAALRKMAAAQTTVMREGNRQRIPATQLVPGDLILVEEGDAIPADARLIEIAGLQTAEAALTGESLPVSKNLAPLPTDTELGDRDNMIFSGTVATYGHGAAVVTSTAMHTEVGRIAQLLGDVPPETTPLQNELDRVGKRLGLIVTVIAVAMVLTIVLVEKVHGVSAFFDALLLGVALAVAAVPEGLPAIVTAVLALGVQRMAKRHAIIRHLPAVETLGSANVIASDKTGTLTKNEMTVRTVVTASGQIHITGSGYEPGGEVRTANGQPLQGALRLEFERALTVAQRANNAVVHQQKNAWRVQGDPTEGALVIAARKAGLQDQALGRRFERIGEVPFSSERKLMSTVHTDAQREDRLLVFTKGAPDILVGRCSHEYVGDVKVPLTAERRTAILTKNEDLAGQALRTLAVAVRELPSDNREDMEMDVELEQELVFLGLIGMIDPPREEARPAVLRAQKAGIRPIMITGDHPKTAAVIASELGIATDATALTGADLQKQSDAELADTVQRISVYARVNPEHKLRIVKALQSRGATVAMTGDGVNDAPALKMADIGVAMGISGTDVSKEAADVILTDDNFATIVAAVEEGRAIFDNIRKFLRYLLSSNMGEVMTMFFGVIFAKLLGLGTAGTEFPLPLLATQILFINLVTDGAPALALGIDSPAPGLMNIPPRPAGEGVITRRMWLEILFIGAVMAAGTLLVLDASMPGGLIDRPGNLRYGQTMAFTTLMLFQLFNVFNARSETVSAFRGLFQNRWLWGAVILSLALHLAVIYLPALQAAFSVTALRWQDWAVCTAVASSVLWLRELTKLLRLSGSRSERRAGTL